MESFGGGFGVALAALGPNLAALRGRFLRHGSLHCLPNLRPRLNLLPALACPAPNISFLPTPKGYPTWRAKTPYRFYRFSRLFHPPSSPLSPRSLPGFIPLSLPIAAFSDSQPPLRTPFTISATTFFLASSNPAILDTAFGLSYLAGLVWRRQKR